MFIAMNRFRVKKGSEEAFEKVWLSRDSQLAKVPGFVEFRLLKGPEHEDFTLYASHSVWQSRATFKPGRDQPNSAPPTGMRARTSRSTSTIRNSNTSRSAKPSGGARPQSPSSNGHGLGADPVAAITATGWRTRSLANAGSRSI
jgi:heme-degrading monooxygenase HmoA